MFMFILLAQNEPKRQPSLGRPLVDLPYAARKNRVLQNSPLSVAQTSSSTIPFFSVLLGCVKWH
jgi:hypothetical protein